MTARIAARLGWSLFALSMLLFVAAVALNPLRRHGRLVDLAAMTEAADALREINANTNNLRHQQDG